MKLFKKISKPILVALSIIGLVIIGFVVYLFTKKNKNGNNTNPLLGNSNMEEMPMVRPTTLYELLEDVTVWDIASDNQFSFTFPKGTLIYKPKETKQPQYVGTNFKVNGRTFNDEEAKEVDFILVPKELNLQKSNSDRIWDLPIKKSLVKLKSQQEIEQYELNLAHSKAESSSKIIYSNVDYIFSFKETFNCEVIDFSPGDYQLNTKKTLTSNDTLEAKTFFSIPSIKLPKNQFVDVFPEAPDYEYYINLRIGTLSYKVPSSKLSSIKQKNS